MGREWLQRVSFFLFCLIITCLCLLPSPVLPVGLFSSSQGPVSALPLRVADLPQALRPRRPQLVPLFLQLLFLTEFSKAVALHSVRSRLTVSFDVLAWLPFLPENGVQFAGNGLLRPALGFERCRGFVAGVPGPRLACARVCRECRTRVNGRSGRPFVPSVFRKEDVPHRVLAKCPMGWGEISGTSSPATQILVGEDASRSA